MERKIKDFINDILNDCVSNGKLNLFYKHVQNYELNASDFKHFSVEKENKPNIHKIPIDILKERLFSKIIEIPEIPESTELLASCDKFMNKIKYLDKTNKSHYYYFGIYLRRYKLLYTSIDEFNNFVEERYNMKRSTLYKYMKFGKLCEEYNLLLECDLSFDEVMNNVPEIMKSL